MLGRSHALKPSVEVGIQHLSGELIPGRHGALIDTGADFSAFPHEFLGELGIDEVGDHLGDLYDVQGETAAGPRDRILYAPGVEIDFMGHRIKVTGYFNPGLSVILLGRGDFLMHYGAEFDCREPEVKLTRFERDLHRDPVVDHVAKVMAEHKSRKQLLDEE